MHIKFLRKSKISMQIVRKKEIKVFAYTGEKQMQKQDSNKNAEKTITYLT